MRSSSAGLMSRPMVARWIKTADKTHNERERTETHAPQWEDNRKRAPLTVEVHKHRAVGDAGAPARPRGLVMEAGHALPCFCECTCVSSVGRNGNESECWLERNGREQLCPLPPNGSKGGSRAPSPHSRDTGRPCVFTAAEFDSCGKSNWLDDGIFSRTKWPKDWWKRGKGSSQRERQELNCTRKPYTGPRTGVNMAIDVI